MKNSPEFSVSLGGDWSVIVLRAQTENTAWMRANSARYNTALLGSGSIISYRRLEDETRRATCSAQPGHARGQQQQDHPQDQGAPHQSDRALQGADIRFFARHHVHVALAEVDRGGIRR